MELGSLPYGVLMRLASQLSHEDANSFRMLAKRFYSAEVGSRYNTTNLSIGRVHKRFPYLSSRLRTNGAKRHQHGFLEVGHELRKHLRRTPPRVLREVDVSGISYPQSEHVKRVLEDLDALSLFERVMKLNLANCVLDLDDLTMYASIMPSVWFIHLSLHCLVLRDDEASFKDLPNAGCKRRVETILAKNRIESVDAEQLQVVKVMVYQLLLLFPRIEMIQLELY